MQVEMADILKGGFLCERRDCAATARKTGNVKTPCACLHGYQGDGFDCHDIDECLNGSANCHKDARCINTPGGYTCECNEGYLGNGFNCTEGCPLPLPSVKIEGLGTVKLLNFNLDFENAVRACHHIGARLLEGITSLQQLEELRRHFNGKMLFRSAGIGLRRKQWLSGGKPFTTVKSWGFGGCGDMDLSTYPPQIWDIPCGERRPVLCQKL
ncbi:stabilin-2-like [Macrobrachium rosenbergii]|uniref:stabilin-2-like n=1 Tax=Macrobrachium rosenbergii TaxID=79674 RepID=UPI0034D4A832